MRVLISTWSLKVGGGEVLAMNLAAELAKRGHTVFLFNQRAELIDRDVVQRLLPAQVRVLSMADKPLISFWAYKMNAFQLRLGWKADFYIRRQQAYFARCLREHQIELVNSHATYSDQLCAPLAQAAGIPLVITEHGEYTQFIKEGRQDFANILRIAKRILAVSNYCRQIIEKAITGLAPSSTLYNGVIVNTTHTITATRHQLGIPTDAFVFGMVARGIETKGWQCAIEAFRQLRMVATRRPIFLILVGGSDYLTQLQADCVAEPDIIFTGRVPNPDFFVAGFDVGMLPTYFPAEALPLAIIEYMVLGKPSIATNVGGIPELLESSVGSTGQLISLEAGTRQPNVSELVAAMRRYYEEPALYETHAGNAREAQRNFTMEACAAQYEQIFEEVIAQA